MDPPPALPPPALPPPAWESGLICQDKNTSNEDTETEQVPSFFGVVYKDHKAFRAAVEDDRVNHGMYLEQAKDLHGSNRSCIKCAQAGCGFLVFAKMRTTPSGKGLVALPDDTTTSKGEVIKQTFKHTGPKKHTLT